MRKSIIEAFCILLLVYFLYYMLGIRNMDNDKDYQLDMLPVNVPPAERYNFTPDTNVVYKGNWVDIE